MVNVNLPWLCQLYDLHTLNSQFHMMFVQQHFSPLNFWPKRKMMLRSLISYHAAVSVKTYIVRVIQGTFFNCSPFYSRTSLLLCLLADYKVERQFQRHKYCKPDLDLCRKPTISPIFTPNQPRRRVLISVEYYFILVNEGRKIFMLSYRLDKQPASDQRVTAWP